MRLAKQRRRLGAHRKGATYYAMGPTGQVTSRTTQSACRRPLCCITRHVPTQGVACATVCLSYTREHTLPCVLWLATLPLCSMTCSTPPLCKTKGKHCHPVPPALPLHSTSCPFPRTKFTTLQLAPVTIFHQVILRPHLLEQTMVHKN